MITLVTGGSKCGKSSFAEKLLDDFQGEKIYLACMIPRGAEAEKAIAGHREMRRERHFKTIEKYTDIHQAAVPKNSALLLECMGNLLANEMFENNEPQPCEKIIRGIMCVASQVRELVIVTNEVSCDGFEYSKEVREYISQLNRINSRLAASAHNVVECVFGIPVIHKGCLK